VTKHQLIDKLNPKERQIVTKMHEMGDVMGQPNKFFQQNVSTMLHVFTIGDFVKDVLLTNQRFLLQWWRSM